MNASVAAESGKNPPAASQPDRTAHEQNVRALLRPASVAVIGASGDATRIGGLIVKLLARHHFAGAVYPVNPKYHEIQGFPCYPSLGDIPAEKSIDVAVVYVSAQKALDVVRECGERGVRGLVMVTAGFAEVGDEGRKLQDELAEVANRYNMAMCGPNCAGIANFTADFVAYGTTNFIDLEHIFKGSVALLTASGGLGNTIFTYCQERRVGLSHIIGLGNEAVSTSADYLDVLVDDPAVSVILANVEAVRDPKLFFAAADRAAHAGKAVVALKGGRSEAGQHSIMTHTAALGGSPQAFAGAFRKHGVIPVRDLEEMADCAMLLTRMKPVQGRRIGVFSLAGGGTGLVSDLAADYGFEVPVLAPATVDALTRILPPIAIPKNPLDPTAGFGRDPEKLRIAIRTFAADPNFDILVFFPLASQVDYSQKIADDLVAVKDAIDKPIVAIWTAGRQLEAGAFRSLHDAGIPLFTSTDAAFRALGRMTAYADFLANHDADPHDYGPSSGQAAVAGAGATRGDLLAELTRFGIRLPASRVVSSASEATEVLQSMRAAVMKIVSPDIAHKTEAGGVRLNVRAADAGAVYDEIVASARAYRPTAVIEGVEVQEMVGDGVEMLVGITTDEQLGPILTVGFGGILTEILRDVGQRPIPVSRTEAHRMLRELRGADLLDGVRGRPPADVEALVDTMLGLSALANAWRDARPEIDLNPVVVLPRGEGAIAVDALIRLSPPA